MGLIPDQGRGLAYGTTFLLSPTQQLQIVAKAFLMVLLAVTSFKALGIYLLADYGLIIVYKIIRRDLIFFLPMLSLVSYFFPV